MTWQFESILSCKNRTCASFSNSQYGVVSKDWGCYSECAYYRRGHFDDLFKYPGSCLKNVIVTCRVMDANHQVILPSVFAQDFSYVPEKLKLSDILDHRSEDEFNRRIQQREIECRNEYITKEFMLKDLAEAKNDFTHHCVYHCYIPCYEDCPVKKWFGSYRK